jgi:hypothetical protein
MSAATTQASTVGQNSAAQGKTHISKLDIDNGTRKSSDHKQKQEAEPPQ